MPKKPDGFLDRVRKQQGRRAENAAALWLRMKGYRILARGLATPGGEIDLIASRKAIVIFAQVKSAGGKDEALGSLTPEARLRIEEAARLWLAGRPKLQNHARRFDLVLLAPGRLPRHLRDAWRPAP